MTSGLEVKIVNKNGTQVEVSDDNRLKVEAKIAEEGIASNAKLEEIKTEIQQTNNKIQQQQRTPTMTRSSGAGTIPAGSFGASISNTGNANGLLLGETIKPGETINIDAGAMNNTLSAISYNGTGTELLVIYLT